MSRLRVLSKVLSGGHFWEGQFCHGDRLRASAHRSGRSSRLSKSESALPDIVAHGGLEIKVCVRTYRLFFVSNTEDFLLHATSRDERERYRRQMQVTNSKRQKWMKKYLADLDKARSSVKDDPPPAAPLTTVERPPTGEIDAALSTRTKTYDSSPKDPVDADHSVPS